MKKIILLLCLLHSLVTMAHKDTQIQLEENGDLKGLPEKYSFAKFDSSTFTLTINNNQITIPECVKDYFNGYKNYTISFSASWYHDPDIMPNYIHMDIVTAEHPYGCQIFFNLDTLEIFQIFKPEMKIKKGDANIYLINKQEIPVECQENILKSIIKK